MSKAKVLVHDGIGYVNNLGYSKYWGVSMCQSTSTTTKTRWRVCINTLGNFNLTFSFSDELKDISEEDAARIAAALYPYRGKQLPKNIEAHISKNRIVLINTVIDKISLRTDKVHTQDIYKETNAEMDSEILYDEVSIKIDDLIKSDIEFELITSVLDGLYNDNISYAGKQVLKKIVNVLIPE